MSDDEAEYDPRSGFAPPEECVVAWTKKAGRLSKESTAKDEGAELPFEAKRLRKLVDEMRGQLGWQGVEVSLYNPDRSVREVDRTFSGIGWSFEHNCAASGTGRATITEEEKKVAEEAFEPPQLGAMIEMAEVRAAWWWLWCCWRCCSCCWWCWSVLLLLLARMRLLLCSVLLTLRSDPGQLLANYFKQYSQEPLEQSVEELARFFKKVRPLLLLLAVLLLVVVVVVVLVLMLVIVLLLLCCCSCWRSC